MSQHRSSKRAVIGLSLVETILAVSLVGLIIVFLLGLLPSSGFMVRQAEQQLSASSYAEEILAELGSVPFSTLKGALGTLSPDSPGFLGDKLSLRRLSDSTVLAPEVALSPVDPPNRLVQAVVTVRWRSGQRDRSVRLLRRYSSVLR